MIEWKIAKPGTQWNCIHVPTNAVYATFKPAVIKGKFYPAKLIYITDFDAVITRQHFTWFEINTESHKTEPKKVYVDSSRGLPKSAATFIKENAAKLKPAKKAAILNRQIDCKPHDRIVSYNYIYRAIPSKGDSPKAMTTNFVTNGAKIGSVYVNDIGYQYLKMGVR